MCVFYRGLKVGATVTTVPDTATLKLSVKSVVPVAIVDNKASVEIQPSGDIWLSYAVSDTA